MIWVIVNVYHHEELLPFFLRYYRGKGVDRFLLLCHKELTISDPDVIVQPVHEDYISGYRDNELLLHFRDTYLNLNDWYIPADLDEFHWFPGLANFGSLLGNFDYIRSKFVDRIALDGKIREINMEKTLDSQFPLAGNITEKLCGGCLDKVVLARKSVDTNSGHHYCAGRPAMFSLVTHHFKWAGKYFWDHMFHKELCYGYNEVSNFLSHYRSFGGINVLFPEYGIVESPAIGV